MYITRYKLSENSFFYLGHRLAPRQNTSFRRVSKDTLRVRTNDTHAYFIGKNAARIMISSYKNKAVDVYIREFYKQIDMRALYPMVAIQEGLNGRSELECEKQVLFGSCMETQLNRFVTLILFCVYVMLLIAFIVYCVLKKKTMIKAATTVVPAPII